MAQSRVWRAARATDGDRTIVGTVKMLEFAALVNTFLCVIISCNTVLFYIHTHTLTIGYTQIILSATCTRCPAGSYSGTAGVYLKCALYFQDLSQRLSMGSGSSPLRNLPRQKRGYFPLREGPMMMYIDPGSLEEGVMRRG
jgi:hypothetical protein